MSKHKTITAYEAGKRDAPEHTLVATGLTEREMRLRDAAPDLFAACELAVRRWDFVLQNFPGRSWKNGDQEAYDAISAALKKARGKA